MELDKTETDILRILQTEGRISNVVLAERILGTGLEINIGQQFVVTEGEPNLRQCCCDQQQQDKKQR